MRWSRSRWMVVVIGITVVGATSCMASSSRPPECDPADRSLMLVAQSVPSGVRVPCVREIPAGWSFAGMQVTDSRTTMWLSTGVNDSQEVEITFAPTCDIGEATEVTPSLDEIGSEIFQHFTSSDPIRGVRFQRFDGGCVAHRYAFPEGTPSSRLREAQEAVSTIPRSQLIRQVEHDFGETLCGAGAEPCEGI